MENPIPLEFGTDAVILRVTAHELEVELRSQPHTKWAITWDEIEQMREKAWQ